MASWVPTGTNDHGLIIFHQAAWATGSRQTFKGRVNQVFKKKQHELRRLLRVPNNVERPLTHSLTITSLTGYLKELGISDSSSSQSFRRTEHCELAALLPVVSCHLQAVVAVLLPDSDTGHGRCRHQITREGQRRGGICWRLHPARPCVPLPGSRWCKDTRRQRNYQIYFEYNEKSYVSLVLNTIDCSVACRGSGLDF